MDVFVPITVKMVVNIKNESIIATIPSASAPYTCAITTFEISAKQVAVTCAERAQVDPVKISENLVSEIRLFHLLFIKTTISIFYSLIPFGVSEYFMFCNIMFVFFYNIHHLNKDFLC